MTIWTEGQRAWVVRRDSWHTREETREAILRAQPCEVVRVTPGGRPRTPGRSWLDDGRLEAAPRGGSRWLELWTDEQRAQALRVQL